MMIRLGSALMLGAVVVASGPSAMGDYVLSVVSDGASSLEVRPGDSFGLDIVLASDAAEVHNSSIFRLVFSDSGLWYDRYAWSAPYETGSIFDDSSPFIDDLSVQIDALTLAGVGYETGVIDIELSNVVPSGGVFGDGLLVSLDFTVPADLAPGSLFIDVAPDAFANGFGKIATTAGTTFELLIVPSPGGFGLILLGGFFRRSRGRRD